MVEAKNAQDSNGNNPRRVWIEGPEKLGRPRLLVPAGDASAVEAAWNRVSGDESADSARALLTEVRGEVTEGTLRAIRGQLISYGTSALAHQAREGKARIILTFAGQAQTYFDDLIRLYEIPAARKVIEVCGSALEQELNDGAALEGLHPQGLRLVEWLQNEDVRPHPDSLKDSAVSQPLIFIAQAAQLAAMERFGFAPESIADWAVATTGHSQGIMAALLAAEAHGPDTLAPRAADMARYMLWQGIRMQSSWGRNGATECPMVAVTGMPRSRVEEACVGLEAAIALTNAPRRFVVSGQPSDLELMIQRLEQQHAKELAAFEKGLANRPFAMGLERLAVSAPFHSPFMADGLPALKKLTARMGLWPNPADLAIPMLRTETGEIWNGEDLSESQSINPVDWVTAMHGARKFEPTHVIDAGPGAGVSPVSALCMRGFGVQVIAAATDEGETTLMARDSQSIVPPGPWAQFAPRVIEHADGTLALENRFTREAGRPPILLPGMTPSTVESDIVAAAANAGFMSELAGGGQTSEAIFRERAAELLELLKPGEGYVVNTLYLDPYLWGLQVGKDRLVQKLRAEGHPILGVTITAGIPPVEEATSLLKSFRELGMNLNSLKVGNDDQIRQVLSIADSDDGEFIIQIEGGRAGGHHSFDNLEELLLTWYPRIRRRSNLLLTVGGGIGSAERVRDFLTGTWSLKYNVAPMPVDAVFLGTALMAAAEAKTSPAVKRTLAEARGTDKVLGRGQSSGGVRSGLSGLGADIYYIDNHAAKTAALLDSIAGDAQAVAAKREMLIDTLSKTAKPYFGDIDAMSYHDALTRLIELMALGRGERYQDGIWLDVTHRARYGRMLRRALQRCLFSGVLPTDDALDAPTPYLAKLLKECPELHSTPVLPEDVRYFVEKVCGPGGKPVPFVPVIDENIRRWYCSDSLWQSHDDRYDPEQVLIIPGPNAVEGIDKPDVPVADLMNGFLSSTFEALGAPEAIEQPSHRNIALSAPICLFGREERPNPVPALLATAGDRIEISETDSGLTLSLRHDLPLRGHDVLELEFDVVHRHPFPLRASADFVERIRRFYSALMPREVSVDASRLAAYRRVTSDNGPGTPEQIFFATGLPAMMQVVLDPALGLDPLSLLHLSSEVKQLVTESVPGPYTVHPEPARVSDEAGGRRLAIRATVKGGGRDLAQLDQVFFVRSFDGEIPSTYEPIIEEEQHEEASIELARPRQLFSVSRQAPTDLAAFAHISGDLNPIHRDPALAALAGLPCPIVHGQWTAAMACALLVEDGRHLRRSQARFMAPVMPGAELEFKASVVARSGGDEVVELEVTTDGTPVLQLEATLAARSTALVFPGQGSQRRGMGMETYKRSKAARAVWDRADAHTQERYGFSLLEVVGENPRVLDVGGDVIRHPEGVLNVTQFTQVALTVLSCAGIEELRETGVCPEDAWICGHSVGEYSALTAVTGIMPLEALVDAVYHRGLTMQAYVPRDEMGRSDYAMGVIRPNRARFNGQAAVELVDEVAASSGFPLYVVNHNILDRQYAVAGHLSAIAVLEARLLERAPDGSAWIEIPGIDVPFHSPLLVDGVDAFRKVLERCIPADVDIERLKNRYVPNLVARPFELTTEFVDAMVEATGETALEKFGKKPEKFGRQILIELLAWQFASPVRWIETQAILADDVEQIIEIGPASAPVLTNMFLSSFRSREDLPLTLHAERDYEVVLGMGEEVVEPEPSTAVEHASPEAAQAAPVAVAVATAPVTAGPTVESLEDENWSVTAALKALLALRVGIGLDEVGDDDTVDGLLGGNSARRNQVLLDLGKEFGAGAVDGAHELPVSLLGETLERSIGARYRHPGPCLKASQTQALGALGLSRKNAETTLESAFGLGAARREAVLTTLSLELDACRAEGDAVKAAGQRYARREGISLERATAGGGGAQASVDPGALIAVQAEHKAHWLDMAKSALRAGGLDPSLVDRALNATPTPQPLEVEAATGRFDAQKHVALTGSDIWARADMLRWYWDLRRGCADNEQMNRLVRCAHPELLEIVTHLMTREHDASVAKALTKCQKAINKSLKSAPVWAGETALVTGAGPESIAESITARLLEGGARVIVTTSRPTRSRLARFKRLYRNHGARGAELHVVPFDQGSFEDIDNLCSWLCSSAYETRGANRIQIKGPWLPTMCFPFGAVPAEGDPTTLDAEIASTLQVNLIGVEKLVGSLASELSTRGQETAPVHVVLPLSPNHGQMGRDGLYAEAKIGLEALMVRWQAEYDRWGRSASLCGARIGWVRGTGLMAGLDKVYKKVEAELGIQTFSPQEMADAILGHCTHDKRKLAQAEPQEADITGGFAEVEGLREVITMALNEAKNQAQAETIEQSDHLPRLLYEFPELPASNSASRLTPSDHVVVVGYGEVGPFGNGRIRWSAEQGEGLSHEAALELAWLCGCIRFEGAEWVDAESGDVVDTTGLVERYELNDRIGIRELTTFDPANVVSFTEVVLSEDMTFHLPDAAMAESFRMQDPEHTQVIHEEDGGCQVIRRAGARVRVPRIDPIDRDVAGQLPEGYDLGRMGFDAQQLEQTDPVAVYNLLATAEAFRAAGLSPEELWSRIHPAKIGCTVGSGIGGQRALRRLYTESVLDQNEQADVLQETLINVSAAYAGMSYYGGYGSMINPVSACATAAVSIEVGADLLRAGKADFVVAGAYDDLGIEGARGFAEMQATISAENRISKGLEHDQSSRPCDARRGGFVEAQGGGTTLMCRADTAIALGLPIYAVVAGAWSCGDGLQKSVPAPGPGLLSIGAGGTESPLGKALGHLGLTADDIGVVSMHGTSTEANDLNETRLHANLAEAMGRSEGNPLPIIAQKALTGHCKGGAAAWQTNGLIQAMRDSVIPPMRNLEEPDRRLADRQHLVFPDAPIRMESGSIRAGLITSLGFGHVGAALCLAHPDVLLEGLPKKTLAEYAERRGSRWKNRLEAQYAVLLGDEEFFMTRSDKQLDSAVEKKLLLDPEARID